MAAIQLNFTLRTSGKCKTVHLVGSWDSYAGRLPLSKDPSKTGGWRGVFKFPGSVLQQGQRYWYYYIIDGYHISHDPARESVTEPTTGRALNILDIPAAAKTGASETTSKGRHNRRPSSIDVAKGRSLSPSQIKSPVPHRPHQVKAAAKQFSAAQMEQLTQYHQASQTLESESEGAAESDSDESDTSDGSSDVPWLSGRSSNSSSPSSVSSTSSCCTCERYAITRAGARVKLDCGGTLCGSSDSNSDCSSDSDGDGAYAKQTTRRQGMLVRR